MLLDLDRRKKIRFINYYVAGGDLDPFDLICHVAFDRKPLTRRERAENVKKRDVFAKYGDQARSVLDALLAKYADEGMLNLAGLASDLKHASAFRPFWHFWHF